MDLLESARSFVEAYHARPELVAEQRGWRCTIAMVAQGADQAVTVYLDDGRVTRLVAGHEKADVVVASDQQTLCDVLELRRSPNEPYLFGELTVQGPEADFMRLDYVVTLLCPA